MMDVITYQQSGSSCGRLTDRLLVKPMLHLGVVQVVVGTGCIALNLAAISMHLVTSDVGHGFWCSVFFIVAGSFGIVASRRRVYGFVVTCMILSIVAAVFCIPLIIAASTAVAMEPDNYHYRTLVFDDIDCCMEYTESSHSSGYSHCCTESIVNSKPLRILIHVALLTLGVVEGIVAILTASLCCHAVCGCSQQSGGNYGSPLHYTQAGQGMQLIIIQGQSVPTQHVAPTQQQYNQQQSFQPTAPPEYDGQVTQMVHSQPPPAYNP